MISGVGAYKNFPETVRRSPSWAPPETVALQPAGSKNGPKMDQKCTQFHPGSALKWPSEHPKISKKRRLLLATQLIVEQPIGW